MITKRLVAVLVDHLQTGARPIIPAGGELAWQWFIDLDGTRTWHNAGPNPISFAEIEAYCRLNREPMEPRHVAVIRAMDAAYLKHHATREGSAGPENPEPPKPITAALFDAMFG